MIIICNQLQGCALLCFVVSSCTQNNELFNLFDYFRQFWPLPWPSTSHRDRLLIELTSTFHNRSSATVNCMLLSPEQLPGKASKSRSKKRINKDICWKIFQVPPKMKRKRSLRKTSCIKRFSCKPFQNHSPKWCKDFLTTSWGTNFPPRFTDLKGARAGPLGAVPKGAELWTNIL